MHAYVWPTAKFLLHDTCTISLQNTEEISASSLSIHSMIFANMYQFPLLL